MISLVKTQKKHFFSHTVYVTNDCQNIVILTD